MKPAFSATEGCSPVCVGFSKVCRRSHELQGFEDIIDIASFK